MRMIEYPQRSLVIYLFLMEQIQMEQTQSSFLLDDETGNGNMVYDQTASGIDVGDDIIHESGIDFSKKNVTITDSSGASGTIVKG